MHRVELKEACKIKISLHNLNVPNAPCGVERFEEDPHLQGQKRFLMHRVELKATGRMNSYLRFSMFLMHRVELKVSHVSPPEGFGYFGS